MRRTALITGASGGIGQALVRHFSENGYFVIATDIADEHGIGSEMHYIPMDLALFCENEIIANDFFIQINRLIEGGRLDVLINNAAAQVVAPARHLTRQDWCKTINVNVLAPFLLVQGLFDELVNAHGTVINISSIHAKLTKPGFSAYATSKAALSGLTRALAVEFGDRVRVNGIAPAAIATKMLISGFADDQDRYQKLQSYHPSRTLGTPVEVARLALALASMNSPFLNGTIVDVDGGIGARLHDPG